MKNINELTFFGENTEKNSGQYCTLRTYPPTWNSAVLMDNTALSHVGGYVRRVQYYPCECCKKDLHHSLLKPAPTQKI